jgi:N-acetylneuraminic acid mutarotase
VPECLSLGGVGWIERLEPRRLFSGFSASIDFQPAALPAPTGALIDDGAIFGDRGNGFTYGWNGRKPAPVRHQQTPRLGNGPDSRYDNFAVLQPHGVGSAWQIAVPDGRYTVEIVAGAPQAYPARYEVLVNGSVALSGRAIKSARWIDQAATVSVTNGMITLTAPRGITDRIDFITLTQVASPSVQPFTWQTMAPAPEPLAEAESIGVGGKLYIFGGYNVTTPNYLATTAAESYDPSSDTWTSIADVPQPLTHAGIASDGTSIYLAGGYLTDYSTGQQTFGNSNVWRYDIASNTWSAFVPLPAPVAAGTLVLLGTQLHFFNGVDPSRTGQTEHWVLDLTNPNPQWTDSTPVPFSRNHVVGAALDGKIYAIGGQPGTDDAAPASNVLVWDPANPGTWTAVASLPEPISHAAVGVIDGKIILAGGTTTGDIPIAAVFSYDPVANTWFALAALPAPRLAPTGGVVGNQFIVTTGYDNGGLTADTWAATID